jgi:hypothetical protein
MKLDEFKSIVDNPNLIPGIYNYCDRWCERCHMTARCSVFLTTPQLDPEDFENEDAFFAEVFKGVHESFQLTMEMIQESADERGIDLNEIDDDPDWKEKREIKQSEIKSSPMSVLAWEYSELTRSWLKDSSESLKGLGENLQQAALMDLPDRNPEKEAAAIKDALEVIPYYMHQIYVKLMRAQDGRIEDDEWFEENDFPKDSDGSAKVALIGIDSSIFAWGTFLSHLTDQEDTILPILSLLQNLRNLVEASFPDARGFKRPGFDAD